ncbi:MAG: putative 4-hydroxybenzoate polyprenyltransferase [Pseudomonadota bacterium]|nr:putative 4-hydroxybenzoate polyprenyltransferase [Pseudomonadota bacterium]
MFGSLKLFLQDIKIAHSLFAMPFAIAMMVIVWNGEHAISWLAVLLIIGCLVAARSFAMGMNRVLDATYDSEQQRTANRMIPQGRLSRLAALCWSLAFAALFIVLSANLSRLAFYCSVPLLLILGVYPLTKRYTFLCHWYLGVCLGLTPLAVMVACGMPVNLTAAVLGASVASWVAGFDIIYSLQDEGYDRRKRLFSIPACFGAATAIWCSRLCFLLTIVGFSIVGVISAGGWSYWLGVSICAGILLAEHLMLRYFVRKQALSNMRVNRIFFHANALMSLLFLVFVSLDVLLQA